MEPMPPITTMVTSSMEWKKSARLGVTKPTYKAVTLPIGPPDGKYLLSWGDLTANADVPGGTALNVTVHAAETSIGVLTGEYLPMLLQTAGAISAETATALRGFVETQPLGDVAGAGVGLSAVHKGGLGGEPDAKQRVPAACPG